MNRKLLSAIATLIAAFTVAVATHPAPANAAVGSMSASLSIVPDGGGGHYVTVNGVLRTSSQYEAGQLYGYNGCRAVFRLWGDDPASDDLLFDTSGMSHWTEPDGLHFQGFWWAPAGRLNEDWGGDEVYAGVRLTSYWAAVGTCSSIVRSAQSNTVYGNF
jgi:hypothetical protein